MDWYAIKALAERGEHPAGQQQKLLTRLLGFWLHKDWHFPRICHTIPNRCLSFRFPGWPHLLAAFAFSVSPLKSVMNLSTHCTPVVGDGHCSSIPLSESWMSTWLLHNICKSRMPYVYMCGCDWTANSWKKSPKKKNQLDFPLDACFKRVQQDLQRLHHLVLTSYPPDAKWRTHADPIYNQSASNKTEPVCSWLSMLLSSCLEILVGFHLWRRCWDNCVSISTSQTCELRKWRLVMIDTT